MEIKHCLNCGNIPEIKIIKNEPGAVIVRLHCEKNKKVLWDWYKVPCKEIEIIADYLPEALHEAVKLWNERCEE